LRENARKDVLGVAKILHMKPSRIFTKIKFLDKYIIKKNCSLIDFSKFGYKSQCFVAVKVKDSERELLGDFLFQYKQINSLYLVNSGYDFMFEVFHRNHLQFKEFLELIEEVFSVEKIHTFIGLDELRKEDFVFN